LNFGQVRQVRRRLVGIAPTFPKALRDSARVTSDATISERWNAPVSATSRLARLELFDG
jgi:hypothetical protein